MSLQCLVSLAIFAIFGSVAAKADSNQLVTMQKAELMDIIDCVSTSGDKATCDKFNACEVKMAVRVVTIWRNCIKEVIPGDFPGCVDGQPLFESPEVPSKIFDCISRTTTKLNAEEQKQMLEFEACTRTFHTENCNNEKHRHRNP